MQKNICIFPILKTKIPIFILYFEKQPLTFKFIGIIQWFPSETGKNDQNWENIAYFWIGNREKFGCKIDQNKITETQY